MNNVIDVIKNRSSIRKYKTDMLSDEMIKCLAETILLAPTATNKQELHVSIVKEGHPVLDELQNDLNPNASASWYYHAPVVYFISGQEDFSWTECDAGIASENIHLAAASLGLGSVILGCVKKTMHGEKKEHYNKILGIPEGYSFNVAVAVGYPDTEKAPHTIDFDRDVTYVD